MPVTTTAKGGVAIDLLIRFESRSWYAPGVGLVHREAGPGELVLVPFTPGPR